MFTAIPYYRAGEALRIGNTRGLYSKAPAVHADTHHRCYCNRLCQDRLRLLLLARRLIFVVLHVHL